MSLSRLIILLLSVLVIAGFAISFRKPVPGLYPTGSVPVRERELWEINFR